MKIQWLTGIAGAVAIAAAAIYSFNPAEAQMEGRGFGREPLQMLEQLDLSDAQATQLQAIRADAKTQMLNVLNETQRSELQAALADGTPLPRAMRDLDLSDDQRNQLWAIFDSSRDAAHDVLTDEQRDQMRAQMRDMRPGSHGLGEGSKGGMFMGQLDLTEQQQAQLDSIRDNAKSQALSVLTDAQRSELAADLQSGEPLPHAMQNLDLSDDQRQQLWEIFESSRDASQNVLTEEQRQQLEEHRSERGQFHGQRGQRGGNRQF